MVFGAPRARAFLGLLLLVLENSAQAGAPARVCYPINQLKSQISLCSGNKLFMQAAVSCLEKIEKDIAAQQAVLNAAMLAANTAAADAQNAKMANQVGNLAAARATLQELLDEASQAKQELAFYLADFAWPGGYSAEAVASMHLESEFSGYACYASPQSGVTTAMAVLDQKIAELRSALATTGGQQGLATRALQRLDENGSSVTAAANGAGFGSRRKTEGDASTVTGSTRDGSLPPSAGSASNAQARKVEEISTSPGSGPSQFSLTGGSLQAEGSVVSGAVPGSSSAAQGNSGTLTNAEAATKEIFAQLRQAKDETKKNGQAGQFTSGRGPAQVFTEQASADQLGPVSADRSQAATAAEALTLFQRVHAAHERFVQKTI